MRKNAVYLTEDQMDTIARYVIKERGVELRENGQFVFNDDKEVEFRVLPSRLAKEVSGIMGFPVNGYQVHKATNWFARQSKRFNATIVLPAASKHLSTVQEEMLKEKIAKLEGELVAQKKIVTTMQERMRRATNLFGDLVPKGE